LIKELRFASGKPFFMSFTNIEIKAKTNRPEQIREILLARNARFAGTDHQTDTYFNVPEGRLKLRQGNIENNLIFYNRPNEAGPKKSEFRIVPVPHPTELAAMLRDSIGVLTVVKKSREIYFIDNIKFHIDIIEGLGNFVEIEAGNLHREIPVEQLYEQCNQFLKLLEIDSADLIDESYSDMLLKHADGNVH
jgi:adenylate cyclase, class 2